MSRKRSFQDAMQHVCCKSKNNDQDDGKNQEPDPDEHRTKRQRTKVKQTARCSKCGKALPFWLFKDGVCRECKDGEEFYDSSDGYYFDTDFGHSCSPVQCKSCDLVFNTHLSQNDTCDACFSKVKLLISKQ